MDSVSNHTRKNANSDISVIPGGLTGHLQPADVSWNKPFKQAYKALYNDWMATGEKVIMPAGNMRAPDKALCLRWVKEAWNSVTSDVIRKSFRVCGISVNPDGSEDSEIHSIKEGEIAAKASPIIKEKTATLLAATNDNDSDPFDDSDIEEDNDELGVNEVAVYDV